MRRLLLLTVAMLGTAIGVGACSSSSPNSASTSTTTTAAAPVSTTTVPDVSKYILSINDLPTGWSVNNDSSGASTGKCYSGLLKAASPLSFANVHFAQGGTTPALSQILGYYSNGSATYAKLVSTLNACKSFTITVEGHSGKGTLGQLSFPPYGEQSTAYNATIDLAGFTLNEGFALVRKGNYVTQVGLGDIGSLDTATLTKYVELAVNKLP